MEKEVSVILPIRNEEKYIEKCLISLLEQDYPKEKTEIIFADGMSSDNTRKIIRGYKDKGVDIFICNNPGKTVPYGMNIGIKKARGKYIVRMDAHSEYSPDYISKCVYYLEKTGADNVGGPMITKGNNFFQQVVAESYSSPFALGGGKFHDPDFEGYTDTVYLGAYKRDTLIKIGMYDTLFVRNQDDELNLRLLKRGGKIYLTPEIKSVYYPRDKVKTLFSQYFQYGEWKVEVIRKHKMLPRISHIIPLLFALYVILGGFFAVLSLIFGVYIVPIIFAGIALLYIALCFIFALQKKSLSFKGKLTLCYVFFILHFSYGLGFLKGIFDKKGRK